MVTPPDKNSFDLESGCRAVISGLAFGQNMYVLSNHTLLCQKNADY
jgi:hypothetical protein